jgi:alkylation response protein AidB-like acyl-CoA dehydrogenase
MTIRRPIGAFQLVQDIVAHMLSQLTAMQTLLLTGERL